MVRRRRFSLGGILSGRPELGAMILFLLLALALGLAGGYLLVRRYPPPPRPAAPSSPASGIGAGAWSRVV
ncbi:MAG TPA: hypothetical protein VIG69_11915 [Candidatus Methylomirabilis sp.]|jgi:hypothetical protein